ncbi:MAG: tetratricopeptide repeat protein, partial [Chloroflexia bacterium]|nr:tetratricopeptide repeat protein [Chloroflexia bacterium]
EVLFRRALATVTSPALRSRLNVHYAALLLRLGRLLEALEACEAAQDALPEDLAGFAANLLGILYAARGRNQEALMAYERSLEAYRRTGDNRQIVKPLANLGPLLLRLGRVEQALKTLREGLELARAIGDRRGETHFLNNLGLAYFQQQNYANACTYYQACADLCLELNNESVRMVALYNLAEIALIQDQAPTAQTLAQEAVGLAERFGDQRNQALALRILGMAELSLGQHEAAAPILGQALSLARTTQSPPVLLDAVYGWANLLLARGATDQAAELLALLRHHPATDRHLLAQAEERAGGLPLPILSPIEAERLLSGL